jgi:hypothetical protein
MLGKIITTTLLVLGLGTTGIIANESSTALKKLTSKHEKLSKKIIAAYGKKDKGNSVLAILNTLESEQKTLKSQIHNPEINNLLTFLTMCIKDLKTVVKKPYSSNNAQRVADLSTSIQEGSHYIRQSI